MTEIVDSFESRLKKAMDKKNIKSIELANKMNLNKGIISKYLNGKYKPKQDRLLELSKLLEVNVVWLMGYDVPMNTEQEEITKDEFAISVVNWLEDKTIPKEKKIAFLESLIETIKKNY